MQEQHTAHRKPFNSNDFKSLEATERLEVLFDQHAQVAEQLRELHNDVAAVQPTEDSHWNELENQVARLRHEIENFKQAFAPTVEPLNFVFDGEMTFNFLSLET